jgi:hypothetical protein
VPKIDPLREQKRLAIIASIPVPTPPGYLYSLDQLAALMNVSKPTVRRAELEGIVWIGIHPRLSHENYRKNVERGVRTRGRLEKKAAG